MSAAEDNGLYEDLLAATRGPRPLEREDEPGPRRLRSRGWLVRRTLLAADLFGLVLAFALTETLVQSHGTALDRYGLAVEIVLFVVTLPAWVVVAKLYGLYDHDEERTDHSTADEFAGVLHMTLVGVWLAFVASWATHLARPDAPKLVTFWALAVALISLSRAFARSISRRNPSYVQNTVIVGAGDVGQLVARKYLQHPEYGINLIGFVDRNPKEAGAETAGIPVLGGPEGLPALVEEHALERVVIAFSNESHEDVLEVIRSLKDLSVQIDIVPRFFEVLSPSTEMHTVEGLPVLGLPAFRLSRSSKLLKRAMDLAVSSVGLVLLAPLFALLWVAIKLDSPGPFFFRQVRTGINGKPFMIYKLRTMRADAEELKATVAHLNKHARDGGDPRMFKIAGDPRITRVGRLLRHYSIDELPQLVNVFRGDMSLVGPRPLILDEDRHVGAWARRRLDLKPGITGVWQVLGRSGIPFDEMVRLDYLYVTNWSLHGDLALLIRTLPVAVRGARDEVVRPAAKGDEDFHATPDSVAELI